MTNNYVLPAYAGMSPLVAHLQHSSRRAPRLRGDEPLCDKDATTSLECSPPTRG